uniref:Uncharacterized protein n=1 Tax=Timema tahoe TaxID=61484 RepID=A0A7R9IHM7_9NEOP|nr:unnamed protein product [Timema tahoe]
MAPHNLRLSNLLLIHFLDDLVLLHECGFPNEKSVSTETRGHFSTRFSGCLKELSWNKNYIVTDFSHYTGENIGSCDLGHG